MEMTNIGVKNLSGAIVAQAVEDYCAAYRALLILENLPLEEREEGGEEYKRALISNEKTILEVMRFFFSDWFTLLSSRDPVELIAELTSHIRKYKEVVIDAFGVDVALKIEPDWD